MTELDRLTSQLRRRQPEFVKSFKLALDEDLDGDPAVTVWVIVDDGEVEGPNFPAHSSDARHWISDALSATRIARWPYLRFRAESEVTATEKGPEHEPAH